MIKLEKTEVFGWESAIRGMRNPMNSWDKSDSFCSSVDNCHVCSDHDYCEHYFSELGQGERYRNGKYDSFHYLGKNDLKLMKNLSKAGNDHAKYLRMINVTLDITAPLYWWKEYDTYKVGTVANSCSTMHKIHDKEFTIDDFSCEHLTTQNIRLLLQIIDALNYEREDFVDDKDKTSWWQMIQLLPSSYNQKRTVQLNYQVLKNMYHSRKNHKLDEWTDFCEWIKELPYFKEIVLGEDK